MAHCVAAAPGARSGFVAGFVPGTVYGSCWDARAVLRGAYPGGDDAVPRAACLILIRHVAREREPGAQCGPAWGFVRRPLYGVMMGRAVSLYVKCCSWCPCSSWGSGIEVWLWVAAVWVRRFGYGGGVTRIQAPRLSLSIPVTLASFPP